MPWIIYYYKYLEVVLHPSCADTLWRWFPCVRSSKADKAGQAKIRVLLFLVLQSFAHTRYCGHLNKWQFPQRKLHNVPCVLQSTLCAAIHAALLNYSLTNGSCMGTCVCTFCVIFGGLKSQSHSDDGHVHATIPRSVHVYSVHSLMLAPQCHVFL